jgi:hypothetical protein
MLIDLKKEINTEKSKQLENNPDEFVNNVKMLLADNTADDIKVLRNSGLDGNINRVEKQRGNAIELEKFDNEYGDVFSIDQVRTLCMNYKLRFLSSGYYIGTIDHQVASKIKEFTDKHLIDVRSSRGYADKFFILAPEECFNLTYNDETPKRQLDPILFYEVRSGYYRMIHKWGQDFTLTRAITGWKWRDSDTHSAYWNLIFTAMLFAISGMFTTSLLGTLLMGTISIIAGFILGCIATAASNDSSESSTSLVFTVNNWNQNRRSTK